MRNIIYIIFIYIYIDRNPNVGKAKLFQLFNCLWLVVMVLHQLQGAPLDRCHFREFTNEKWCRKDIDHREDVWKMLGVTLLLVFTYFDIWVRTCGTRTTIASR